MSLYKLGLISLDHDALYTIYERWMTIPTSTQNLRGRQAIWANSALLRFLPDLGQTKLGLLVYTLIFCPGLLHFLVVDSWKRF